MPEPGTMVAIGKAVKTGFTKTKDLIVGETKKILKEHKERFDKLDEEAKDLSTAVATIQGEIRAMHEKITAIKETSQDISQRVGDLDKKLSAIDTKIGEGRERTIADINETRRELQGNINGTRQEIKEEIKRSSEELQRSIDRVIALVAPPRPRPK